MQATAVIISQPQAMGLQSLTLADAGDGDVVVDAHFSGISTGTEKLLFEGSMPPFPGMQYPLVPGYETVGEIVWAGPQSGRKTGETVFVPGAQCFPDAASLFGASASKLVVPGARVVPVSETLGADATLLALAATAHHAVLAAGRRPVELVVGHGVLGRLVARIVCALGQDAPVVWEKRASRRDGAKGYAVIAGEDDARRDYNVIMDVSGSQDIINTAVSRMARGGEVILAGFYGPQMAFDFTPAFMREASIRIAAEFRPHDINAVLELVAAGSLDLGGLITTNASASRAADVYPAAFAEHNGLKTVLDWRS